MNIPLGRTFARFAAILSVFACASIAAGARPAHAAASTVPTGFVDESMAGGLAEPVSICEVPDPTPGHTPRVLFVEQRTGRVGLVVGATVFTVGTVPGIAAVETERGLLGVAVDPGWPARPYLYVHCTDGRSGNHVAVSRFTLTGDLAYTGTGQLQFLAATRYDLIKSIPDNASNHNGGTVRFGPDGRLYVSIGDDATGCPALDVTVLAGKILRFDVSRLPAGAGGPAPVAILAPGDNPYIARPDSNARLVWAYGLRNPFRFQIDPATGALFVSDVGQDTWEELDYVPAGGMNMGWPVMEGPASYTSCAIVPPGPATAPIAYYDHGQGLVIICGGLYRYPVRGTRAFTPDYDGDCFFLDYYTGFMRRLEFNGATWSLAAPVAGQPNATDWGGGFLNVSDMLELSDGSMWYCRQSPGELRRISRVGPAAAPAATAWALRLEPPRPSPSLGGAELRWTQPARDRVWLAVFDLGGRIVRTIEADNLRDPGEHVARWDGRDDAGATANSGVYFARLEVGHTVRQVRLTLLR